MPLCPYHLQDPTRREGGGCDDEIAERCEMGNLAIQVIKDSLPASLQAGLHEPEELKNAVDVMLHCLYSQSFVNLSAICERF